MAWRALVYAARSLRRSPGFTLMAVAVLALGTGAATAWFSIVDAVLLRPLAFASPERLVQVSERADRQREIAVSWPGYLDLRGLHSFSGVAARQFEIFTLNGLGDPEQIEGSNVSANLFDVLGVAPRLGRAFTADEDRAGGERVVIVTDGFWRRHLGADPRAVGQAIRLGGDAYTVVGVMPPGFRYPVAHDRGEIFVPIGLTSAEFDDRRLHPGISVVARLRVGIELGQARVELAAMSARLAREYPAANANIDAIADSLIGRVPGSSRPRLLTLFGAALLLLLIAYANVANLLLAREANRGRESAVRLALGASCRHLAIESLAQSSLLTLAGCIAGILIASELLDATRGLLADLPRASAIRLDARVLGFAVAISQLANLLFVSIPLLRARQGQHALSASPRKAGARGVLIAAEVALSMVLLAGAGLLASTFLEIARVSPGFRAGGVLTLQTLLPDSRYVARERYAALLGQWLDGVRELPGVRSASFGPLPTDGRSPRTFSLTGRPETPAAIASITPEYFETMGIPLLGGRTFRDQEQLRSAPVAIIDETLAKAEFGTASPIGRRLRIGKVEHEIVGVAGHIEIRGADQPPRDQIYTPFWQAPVKFVTLLVSAPGVGRAELLRGIRHELARLDPDQPVYQIRELEEVTGGALRPKRLAFLLLGGFAAVALLLAAVGISGLTAYAVWRRTREFGVRLALGCEPRNIVLLALRESCAPGLAGSLAGLILAAGLTRFLAGFLFGVSPYDPATWIAVSVLLWTALALAAWLPARRAAAIDPSVALRQDP